MNKIKKTIALLTVMAAASAFTLTAGAADLEESPSDEFGVFTAIAGEGTTYVNLFEVILADKYEDYWTEKCAEIVGDDAADETAEMFRSYISCDLYGQEAVDAYAANPDQMGFDCWYISDARSFEFKDDTITTTTTDGIAQTHTYEYLGITLFHGRKDMDQSFGFSCLAEDLLNTVIFTESAEFTDEFNLNPVFIRDTLGILADLLRKRL